MARHVDVVGHVAPPRNIRPRRQQLEQFGAPVQFGLGRAPRLHQAFRFEQRMQEIRADHVTRPPQHDRQPSGAICQRTRPRNDLRASSDGFCASPGRLRSGAASWCQSAIAPHRPRAAADSAETPPTLLRFWPAAPQSVHRARKPSQEAVREREFVDHLLPGLNLALQLSHFLVLQSIAVPAPRVAPSLKNSPRNRHHCARACGSGALKTVLTRAYRPLGEVGVCRRFPDHRIQGCVLSAPSASSTLLHRANGFSLHTVHRAEHQQFGLRKSRAEPEGQAASSNQARGNGFPVLQTPSIRKV